MGPHAAGGPRGCAPPRTAPSARSPSRRTTRARPCASWGSIRRRCTASPTASTWTSSAPHAGADEKREHWVRWLCREPRGWDEASGVPGSVRYGEREVIDAFFDAVRSAAARAPVRGPLPRLQARAVTDPRLCAGAGAHVGAGAARDLGRRARRVGGRASAYRRRPTSGSRACSSTGWRDHDQLPLGLAVPTASSRHRPTSRSAWSISRRWPRAACHRDAQRRPAQLHQHRPGEPDGWLVQPDDETALADAIVVAVNDAAERSRRGANACRHARASHSWSGVGARVARLYAAIDTTRRRPAA